MHFLLLVSGLSTLGLFCLLLFYVFRLVDGICWVFVWFGFVVCGLVVVSALLA